MTASEPHPDAIALIEQFKSWTRCGYESGYAVLDTETTDLQGEVIELAIIRMDGEVLFNERIRPQGKIQPGAQAVHHITDADLAACHDFAYWWPRIRRLICRYDILVYNLGFDFNALDRSLNIVRPNYYAGAPCATDPYSADYFVLELAQKKAQCVMEAYSPFAGSWSEWHGNYRWAKLMDACQQCGVDNSDLQAHSALGDAMATMRLIRAVAASDPANYPWIGREEADDE